MERQMVVYISDITGFQYICPDCKRRFVRNLDELAAWHYKADPKLGEEKHEPLCSFCCRKELVKHREIRDLIGNLIGIRSSIRSKEIELRSVISAEHQLGKEGQ